MILFFTVRLRKHLPKFDGCFKILDAIMMARKIIVPTTKMITIMKTTPSTPGTMLKSSSTNSDISGGTHAFSQYEQEHPGFP